MRQAQTSDPFEERVGRAARGQGKKRLTLGAGVGPRWGSEEKGGAAREGFPEGQDLHPAGQGADGRVVKCRQTGCEQRAGAGGYGVRQTGQGA